MKRIKIIVAAIVRGALLLSPGTAFAVWQWGKVSALINILAAVGLETIFLFVFSFVAVTIRIAREEAEKRKSVAEGETIDVATE